MLPKDPVGRARPYKTLDALHDTRAERLQPLLEFIPPEIKIMVLSSLILYADIENLASASASFSKVYQLNKAQIDTAVLRNNDQFATTKTLNELEDRGISLRNVTLHHLAYLEIWGGCHGSIHLVVNAITMLMEQKSQGFVSPILDYEHNLALRNLVGFTGWSFEGKDIYGVEGTIVKKIFESNDSRTWDMRVRDKKSIAYDVLYISRGNDLGDFRTAHAEWYHELKTKSGFTKGRDPEELLV